jgi:hypothetical protein
MNKKSSIVAALGEQRLLLPALLNESLTANDRAKYRLTLLQTAKAHADTPTGRSANCELNVWHAELPIRPMMTSWRAPSRPEAKATGYLGWTSFVAHSATIC